MQKPSSKILTEPVRCGWASSEPIYLRYHDEEWGVPVYDDRVLFEFLILEGAQAGLSWLTVLKKREAYRQAFDQFDVRKVSRYSAGKAAALMANAGIIRAQRGEQSPRCIHRGPNVEMGGRRMVKRSYVLARSQGSILIGCGCSRNPARRLAQVGS